jgi:alpha-amylase/alpha-mannosidase (GH57 family)
MNRKVCIHGHFYQPPRENPWLEEIEIQDSAYPYHDWNERINAECYGPNSASRILDPEKRIVDIIDNYARISFDFGPTLLIWMKKHDPELYKMILAADGEGKKRFSGHGGAMAQGYNHLILPLANRRDKRTQVLWGLRDFEHRFGRKPEGMWLPETAVDLETLDIMAEQKIKFVVLAPHQAARVRKKGEKEWRDAGKSGFDLRKPYLCSLPSKRSIAVFFYDGAISHDVAFGGLLNSGEQFAQRLVGALAKDRPDAQIVHIATDGETYGHHRRFGDMALAYCLFVLESGDQAEFTVYGEHLEKFPPEDEVQIVENSSWSCAHGVERWRKNCGCSTGMHPGWSQEWRAPLREAMDWLRDRLAEIYEREMAKIVRDPWKAREEYVDVVLDRSVNNVKSFLSRQSGPALSPEETTRALRLLEIQRNAMLMFTSCGWFFDEISGIETVQVLQYAARAMQLAAEVGGKNLEPEYLALLKKAPSNVPEYKDGKNIYELFVKPAALDLLRVGVHYAVSSLFEKYPETTTIGCYTARSEAYHLSKAGKQKLAVGKARVRSDILLEEKDLSFAVLHFGDHNLMGGVRLFESEAHYSSMKSEIEEVFARSDIPDMIGLMDKNFGTHNYSLWHLFRDEKRKVMGLILEPTLREIEGSFRQIYENNYPLMLAMKDMKIPLPEAFSAPAEFVLNRNLRRLLEGRELDFRKIEQAADEFKKWQLEPDRSTLGFVATQRINLLMGRFHRAPRETNALEGLVSLFRVLGGLGLGLDLWKSQNLFFSTVREEYGQMKDKADKGDQTAREWIKKAGTMAGYLGTKIS